MKRKTEKQQVLSFPEVPRYVEPNGPTRASPAYGIISCLL